MPVKYNFSLSMTTARCARPELRLLCEVFDERFIKLSKLCAEVVEIKFTIMILDIGQLVEKIEWKILSENRG